MNIKTAGFVFTLAAVLSGCAPGPAGKAGRLPEDIEMTLIAKWDDEMWTNYTKTAKRKNRERLYRYEGNLILNTGRFWAVYNHSTGLVATGLAFDNRSPNSNPHIQEAVGSHELAIIEAFGRIYEYEGGDLTGDLSNDIETIADTFYDTPNYQAWGGFEKLHKNLLFSSGQDTRTLKGMAYALENSGVTKGSANQAKEGNIAAVKAKRSKNLAILKSMNELNKVKWESRELINGGLVKGDRVCTVDNKFGFIDEIAGKNVKIIWKGRVMEDDNVFFGNMPPSFMHFGDSDVISFEYAVLSGVDWLALGNVSKCPAVF